MTADLAPRRDDTARPHRAALLRMDDDTGSRRGRRPRAGVLTGIDLLLSARGDDDSSTAAGSAAHQKSPLRRSPFRHPRRLMSRPRIAVPIAILVVAGGGLGARGGTRRGGSAAARAGRLLR